MMRIGRTPALLLALSAVCLAGVGCHTCPLHKHAAPPEVARELDKVTLPDHIIEAPDILLINGVRLVPKPPYLIEPLDSLYIRVTNTLADEPIDGVYVVNPDGRVLLGPSYGGVQILGKTPEQARDIIEEYLKTKLKRHTVAVSLVQSRSLQAILGEHLVQPNGEVDLGTYGSVPVTGLTPEEARAAIEEHLSAKLVNPKVSVSVAAYNSKVYYIITDGGGFGEQVFRLPCIGNETVLDAMSQINGLPPVASRHRIWLARPAALHKPQQILPIDWKAITRGGETATNYQVLPGDRIYVQANSLLRFDVALSRIISPFERALGITLLGNAVYEALQPGMVGGTQ